MTGSGKTGLCLSLIEEAAIDGVPVIAIDPKGDLGNLLLTFPDLAPEDFRPVDRRGRGAARRHVALTPSRQARRRRGATASPSGARTARASSGCAAAADFAIYTPGSRAGLPVSILSSFAAPRGVRHETTRSRWRSGRAARRRACCRWPASRPRRAAASTRCSRRSSRAPGATATDLDLAGADPAGADAALPEGRRRRSRVVLPVEGALRARDAAERRARRAGVRAVARRRAARSGDAALHGRRASRGSRSSRSRTSATRSGCSSSRCCSTRWSGGCGRRPARRACAPSSTWTRSSATFRRSRIRRRRRRC